ncbi:unnamed protein product [Brachionus calyciflorus]|uniref:Uncharacterized protein n=1 Tax=Brachionus calyciflorus TaxID=104777 RepID=A0A813W4Y4_9BILA|nr:unnamed protein product [Brachionus calyciflorus]
MSDQSIFIHLVAGGLAGTTGAILTCPLEVIKTRLQANQNPQNSVGITRRVFNAHLSPIHLSFPAHKCSAITNTSTILFRTSHGTSSHLFPNDLAFTSRITNTFDKSSQTNINKNRIGKTILSSLKSIVENEGYRGLFKGLGPTVIGVAPYRAIYFFTYANSKSLLGNRIGEGSSLLHVASAFAAGFSAVTITNPIWFIKTRMQVDQSRRGQSAFEVINKILKEKGPLGFYKGISASYFGVCESALYFVVYEKLKSISTNYNQNTSDSICLTAYFTSAGFSKTLAALICYPHEVARTRLRLEGSKYTGFFQTLGLVVREESFRGLYKGMGTHLIRQIPNTAIVMTTYELIVHYFNKNDSSDPLAQVDE